MTSIFQPIFLGQRFLRPSYKTNKQKFLFPSKCRKYFTLYIASWRVTVHADTSKSLRSPAAKEDLFSSGD